MQEEEARGEAARDKWEEPALPLAAMVFQCREEHQRGQKDDFSNFSIVIRMLVRNV